MDKNEIAFREYLIKEVKKAANILNLNIYRFEIEKDSSDKEQPNTMMQIVFSYPYLYARIFYFERTIKHWEDGNCLFNTIIHELCHMITDPLYGKATSRYASQQEIEDERERLTDYMANLVCQLISKTEQSKKGGKK